MRNRSTFGLAAAAFLFAALSAPLGAMAQGNPNDPTSTQLIETPKSFDGTTVDFQGEAIGEVMVRGEDAWIHLNDDAYMYKNVEEGAELGGYNSGMAVWLPAAEADKISTVGDYKHEGDIVQVNGTFNAACAVHGGDMDIHATDLVVVTPGRRALDPIPSWKIVLAIGLSVGAAGMWFGERRAGHLESRGLKRD